MAAAEKFPFQRLTVKDQSRIAALCGGSPVRPRNVHNFLRTYGKNAVNDLTVRGYFILLAAQTSEELTDDDERATSSFYRGALLYFSTIGALEGCIPAVEKLGPAVTSFRGQDLVDAANLASTRIRKEHEAFCEVATSLRRGIGLEAGSDQMHRLVLVGAGIAHVATMRALDLE